LRALTGKPFIPDTSSSKALATASIRASSGIASRKRSWKPLPS
jgi:hypothetical protein